MDIEWISIDEVIPYENNPRKNDASIDKVAASIKEFGFKQPIVIDKNGIIVVGHTRLEAAKRLGWEKVPCIRANDLTDEQAKAYRLADNKVGEESEWDFELLTDELDNIFDIDMGEFGFDLDDFDDVVEHANLSEKFGVPPFSVLDTKQGYWQDRKKAWKEMGLKSDDGRDAECNPNSFGANYGRVNQTGQSIFDPVLCEIMYRWFCPWGGYDIRLFRRWLRPRYCSE